MRKIFFRLLIVFILIVVAIGIWFSQNWYKMPKYISYLKNPTIENVTIDGNKISVINNVV